MGPDGLGPNGLGPDGLGPGGFGPDGPDGFGPGGLGTDGIGPDAKAHKSSRRWGGVKHRGGEHYDGAFPVIHIVSGG